MSHFLLSLMLLNQWIYNPLVSTLPVGFEPIYVDDRIGLLKNDGNCFITHRGTKTIEDIYFDLESELYQECNENGHIDAFVQSFNKLPSMDELIKTSACESVFYTGHSLGGITSRMAANDASHNVPIAYIVTYGEPKSCCNYTQSNISSIRVINGQDPIPSLPSGSHITHCSSLSLNSMYGTWSDSRFYPTIPLFPILKLHHHHVEEYVKSISVYINNIDK
jgi:hypothetical protein